MLTGVTEYRFSPPPPFVPVLLHWHSRKFREPGDPITAMLYAWEHVGGWNSAVGFTTVPPALPWGQFAHVFVGLDMSWYQLGGFTTGADLRRQGPEGSLVMRGVAWASDANVDTAEQLGRVIGHEVCHLVGLDEAQANLPDAQRWPLVRAGALEAARWVGAARSG